MYFTRDVVVGFGRLSDSEELGAIIVEDGFGFMELVFLKELEKQVLN